MELAMMALDDMLQWFQEQEMVTKTEDPSLCTPTMESKSSHYRAGGSGFVAVYDATNSTTARRKKLHDTCIDNGAQVIFVESICDNLELIMSNIKQVKLTSLVLFYSFS